MSVFRPSARATDPRGREWEIYTYKIELPRRQPPAGTDFDDIPDPRALPFSGLHWIGAGILHALARLLVDIPLAAIRALGSEEWTVEAISFAPPRRSYSWTTTREYRGHVLAQVEGQLARGEVPRPHHATFRGTQG